MTSQSPEGRASGPARRDVLMLGAGAAIGATGMGAGWALSSRDSDAEPAAKKPASAAAPKIPEPQRFVSSQLTAPLVTATRHNGGAVSSGLLFTTPRSPTFRGVAYDDDGQPVWIEPDGNACTDLRVQTYRGRPVLTYWTGEVKEGTGNGKGVILDENYGVVTEVRCGNGVLGDLHEFRLTSRGTALVTSYPTMPFDLSPIGGPVDGYVWGGRFQEIDIETGEVLLDWEGLDHLDLTETFRDLDDTGTVAAPFDPIHVNSVEEDGDALLVSCRHTCALYKIDRRTGELIWRFGGRRSDFEIPEGGEFGWQHDLRRQPDGTLTIFDNHEHAEKTDAVSAVLRFDLDEESMAARLVQALRYEDRYGYAMGSAQFLEDGHVLIGWGMDPYVTEFDANGEVVFELSDVGLGSYRACRSPWMGRPTTEPDLAIGPDGAAHASWNGATEVARWRFLGGPALGRLRELTTVDRAGFETSAQIKDVTHLQVEALARSGRVLARSRVLAL